MSKTTYAGFGFGAIQSGLFLAEAFASGKVDRLVVAEVNPQRIEAVRNNSGAFSVNVATAEGRIVQTIEGVELFNPTIPKEAEKLVEALTEADEIGTALPSVAFFDRGSPSVADLLREAAQHRTQPAVVYTAENNNHAAECLEAAVGKTDNLQFLNTVVGKMSSVVTDPDLIAELELTPVVPGADEAFLVESFNRILISRITLPGFERNISIFEEKDDLLPFEEAKLYGHNAIHAMLGYLAAERGLTVMSQLADHPDLICAARKAFIDESGAALVKKYSGLDPLFTLAGFSAYADNLLERMLNPYLCDPVARVTRDPLRKLAWNDRLTGAIRLSLTQGIEPENLLRGVRSALGDLTDKQLVSQWLKEGAEKADALDMAKRVFKQ